MPMHFEQFYLNCLSHASYMLAADNIAVVVDPQRDVDIYLNTADEHGWKIAHIFETHLHADFVSGHRELAQRTGATVYVSERAGAKFPHVPVREGFELRAGQATIRVIETPGHTPESVCLAVYDPDQETAPWAVLTGDTLFIGDVGRPDLSETHSPQQLAGMLYDSLHNKLLTLPDATLVYPAHGAGSLCGRNMRADRFSTIGTERLTNAALQVKSREEFIAELTSNLPPRPQFFSEDAMINRRGAEALGALAEPLELDAEGLLEWQRRGAFILDTRPGSEYARQHVPGAVCISLKGQFATWAGTVIGLHTPVVIVAESVERMREARMRLARVGIEDVAGWMPFDRWVADGREMARLPQISVAELQSFPPGQILDVRADGEWLSGHIPGARHYPLDRFATTLPRTEENVAVHCKGGYRSVIAAGLLMRSGVKDVVDVVGGFDAWQAAQLPVTTGEATERSAA
ncbi:MAG: rhodanese-like domain-containing protein [Terriglobales bacterium]